jgi:hypothetical protein
LRFHICNPNDPAILVDKGDAQRNEGIFHPEPVIVFCLKDEEHPLVFAQMFSPHQSMVPLLRGLSDFHPDFFLMNIKGNFQDTLRMGNGNPE